ncbi:MAG: hypothetical protein AAF192_01595 [Pseudomonadota bacterium]
MAAALGGAGLGVAAAGLHFALAPPDRFFPLLEAVALAGVMGLLAGGRGLAERLGRGRPAAASAGAVAAALGIAGFSAAHGLHEAATALRWRRFPDVIALINYATNAAAEAFLAILASPAAPALGAGAIAAGLACEALHRRMALRPPV